MRKSQGTKRKEITYSQTDIRHKRNVLLPSEELGLGIAHKIELNPE